MGAWLLLRVKLIKKWSMKRNQKKLSKEKSALEQKEKWPFMEKDSSKENRSDNSAKLHSIS